MEPKTKRRCRHFTAYSLFICEGEVERSRIIWQFSDYPAPPEELKFRIPKSETPVTFQVLMHALSVVCADGLLNDSEYQWLRRFQVAVGMEATLFIDGVSHYAGREPEPANVHEWWEQMMAVREDCNPTGIIVGDE
jgi:hypothetical protein